MSNCKKCNKLISKGRLCERCSALRIDNIKKLGTHVILPVLGTVLTVVSVGKINIKSKN